VNEETQQAKRQPLALGLVPNSWRPDPQPDWSEIKRGSDVELARYLIASCLHQRPTIWADRDFWVYGPQDGCWRARARDAVLTEILELDGLPYGGPDKDGNQKRLNIGHNKANSVLMTAASLLNPCLYRNDQSPFESAPNGLLASNGFLTLRNAQLVLYPHHPNWFQTLSIDVRYDHEAQCPMWMKALSSWFGRDEDGSDKVAMLQEFFGAALFGLAPRYGRALFLVGTGGQGKGQITDVLSGLFPKIQVGAMPPQQWSKEYDADTLAHTALNVVSELPTKAIAEGSIFKAVITGDPIKARAPYGRPYTFRPKCAHLLSANQLPRSLDGSDGFWRRVLLLRLTHQFVTDSGNQADHISELAKKILALEASGVLAWAVEGAQRLLLQDGYTIASSSHTEAAQWRMASDPMLQWLTERTIVSDDDRDKATSQALWNDWKQWAGDNGYQTGGRGHWATLLADRIGKSKRIKRGYVYPIRLGSISFP
jgi:P4 family phage/plasmid primase-like protien